MLFINTKKNWADEFCFPVISIFAKSQIQEIKDILMVAERKGFHRFFVTIPGSNNSRIEFTISEARILIDNAEFDTLGSRLSRELNAVPAIDIVSYILECENHEESFEL